MLGTVQVQFVLAYLNIYVLALMSQMISEKNDKTSDKRLMF